MTRTKKAATSNAISIQEAVKQLKTNEQTLRLALIDIRPDDFDTLKALTEQDFQAVTSKLEQQQQPQLPAHSENLETAETPTQQSSQTTTHEPQKSPIVPQPPQQHLTNPNQPQTSNNGLSLVEMVAKQATEEIAAVDAIAQVRNTLILNNLAVRDAELVDGINLRWQTQKQGYLGNIRDLASMAQQRVTVTPDEINLTQEVDGILSELGKRLTA